MKKIILLFIALGLVYGGYNFYNSTEGQETIEKGKIAKLAYELLNERDPAKILSLLEANQETVSLVITKEIITEEQVQDFKAQVKNFEKAGQEVDKKVLAERYVKDRVTQAAYNELMVVLDSESLSLGDVQKLSTILKK